MVVMEFPAQYNGFRVTAIGDRILSLRVDEAYADQLEGLIQKKIGTQFLCNFKDVTTLDEEEPKEFKDTERRMRDLMHVKISELAEIKKKMPNEIKNILRDKLKKEGWIESSTKELDLKGLAYVNNFLDKEINEKNSV